MEERVFKSVLDFGIFKCLTVGGDYGLINDIICICLVTILNSIVLPLIKRGITWLLKRPSKRVISHLHIFHIE